MIRSIAISHLRGIQQGQLDGLTPITVLVGPNNAGKSTDQGSYEAFCRHLWSDGTVAAELERRLEATGVLSIAKAIAEAHPTAAASG